MKATLTFKLSDDVMLSIESSEEARYTIAFEELVNVIEGLKTKKFDLSYYVEAAKELRDEVHCGMGKKFDMMIKELKELNEGLQWLIDHDE